MGAMTMRRSGWWRRNAVALIALTVLLPATVGGIGWWQWKHAFPDSGRPLWPIEPGEAGTAELENASWGPVQAKILTDTQGLDVPSDSTLVLVGLDVTPHTEKAPTCATPLLVEQSTGRSWKPVRSELGLPYDPAEPDSCVPTLEGETAEPYTMLLPFVVPEDSEGPYWVRVEPLHAESRYLRFPIVP